MTKEKENSQTKGNPLIGNLHLTAIGAGMSATNIMIGHPLDTIKAYSQKNNMDFYQSARTVYGNGSAIEGVGNLYKGAIPNMTRNVVNTAWRVPLTTHGPKVFADTFSMHDNKGNPSQKANIAASFLFTGPIDVSLSSVFEVAKVTKQTGGTYGSLYQSFKDKGANPQAFASTFMRGIGPMYWKNAVGYSSLFVVSKFESDFNERFNQDGQSAYWTAPVSAVTASTIKVGLTNPLDVIKTHKQSAGGDNSTSMITTAQKIIQEHGAKALYRGMGARLAHGSLAAFTGMHIMKLSKAYNQNSSHTHSIEEERSQSKSAQSASR